jgi:hypothetical protein
VLTLGGASFLRTVHNLESEDVGFDPRGVLLFKIDPDLNGYEGPRSRASTTRPQRDRRDPWVASATLSRSAPLAGTSAITILTVPGTDPEGGLGLHPHGPAQLPRDDADPADPWPRSCRPRTSQGSVKVAVVSENVAQRFFPDEDPDRAAHPIRQQRNPTPRSRIVGRRERRALCRACATATRSPVYVPYLQHADGIGAMTFEIRAATSPAALVGAVRGVVESIDPNLPLFDVRTQEEQVSRSIASERQFSRLADDLGGGRAAARGRGPLRNALVCDVAAPARDRIRMALGARRHEVQRMVLGAALRLAGDRRRRRHRWSLSTPVTSWRVCFTACGRAICRRSPAPRRCWSSSRSWRATCPARAAAGVDPAEVLRCEP